MVFSEKDGKLESLGGDERGSRNGRCEKDGSDENRCDPVSGREYTVHGIIEKLRRAKEEIENKSFRRKSEEDDQIR